MSTPEDRLAALLHATEADIQGDGLSRIQTRVVRRKRARLVLVPAAALAVVGLVTTAALSIDRDPRSALQPGTTASPTAPSTYACLQEGRCPTASPAAATYGGPAIWPFTTLTEAQAWDRTGSAFPEAGSAQGVAVAFVRDYLRVPDATMDFNCAQASVLLPYAHTCLRVVLAGKQVAVLGLVRFGPDLPWSVAGAATGGLRATQPSRADSVTSPLTVTGTLDQGVDENVRLTLLAEDGREIAQGGAPAGSAVPWSGALTWTDTSWTHGALVGQTFSAKDGTLTRLFAVPVTRG